MKERFEGDNGRRLRVEAFAAQKMVVGNKALADEMADRAELLEIRKGEAIIHQDGEDNDIYFVFSGTFG